MSRLSFTSQGWTWEKRVAKAITLVCRLTRLLFFVLQNYKDEAQKQRKIIYQLEKERDRYINEASELTQKVLQHMEDVKVREMQIFDYKKKIAEAETKLKQQQVW